MVKLALISRTKFDRVELREFGELISSCMKMTLLIDNRGKPEEFTITPTETEVTVVALNPGDPFPYDSVFMRFGEGSGSSKIEALAKAVEQSCKMEWNRPVLRSSALTAVVTLFRNSALEKDRKPIFQRLFDAAE